MATVLSGHIDKRQKLPALDVRVRVRISVAILAQIYVALAVCRRSEPYPR